jgi:hypothetical protein
MNATAAAYRPIGRRALVCGAIALAGIAVHLLIWQFSEPTAIFSDFFKAYYAAGRAVWTDGPNPPWSLQDGAALTFINLPILAFVFAPFGVLEREPASFAFLSLGIVVVLATWALLTRLGRLDARTAALLFFVFMVDGPMVNSLREGNTTHMLLLLLVVALLLWRAGHDYAAGLVLGVCAVFKLPFLLFGLYFVLRRRWRIVAGGATTIVSVVLLSLWYFGREINVAWYNCCVEPFVLGVIPAFNVQSIDGFLIRLTTGETLLRDWAPMTLPLAYKVIRMLLLAALYGAVFWLIRRADPQCSGETRVDGALNARDYLEFALVINLAVVTSPVSWTHYYLLLLLPWSLYVGGLLPLPDDAVTRTLMVSGLVLSALPVVMPDIGTGWPAAVLARTVVSLWLFGGLMMLAALLRGAWHGERVRASLSSPAVRSP